MSVMPDFSPLQKISKVLQAPTQQEFISHSEFSPAFLTLFLWTGQAF